VAKIPKIQLIVLFIVSSKDEDGHFSTPITLIFLTNHNVSSQNQARQLHGIKVAIDIFSHNIDMIQNIIFFILAQN